MEAKNVDSLLSASLNTAQQDNAPIPVAERNEDSPLDESQAPVINEPEKPVVATQTEAASDSNIDEYGNELEKPKLYTKDEVSELVKERLDRFKKSMQSTEQLVAQPVKQENTATQETEENWETQLESFVERTIEKKQARTAEQQWRHEEAQRQAAFESKFTDGMSRYNDFRDVVQGRAITNNMLLATRNLDNPAAFIYGAAKLHGAELDNIAKINDPYVQAAEIGRLHERMVKTKKMVTNASKPLEEISSDMAQKKNSEYGSLEDRIHQHAKQKRK